MHPGFCVQHNHAALYSVLVSEQTHYITLRRAFHSEVCLPTCASICWVSSGTFKTTWPFQNARRGFSCLTTAAAAAEEQQAGDQITNSSVFDETLHAWPAQQAPVCDSNVVNVMPPAARATSSNTVGFTLRTSNRNTLLAAPTWCHLSHPHGQLLLLLHQLLLLL